MGLISASSRRWSVSSAERGGDEASSPPGRRPGRAALKGNCRGRLGLLPQLRRLPQNLSFFHFTVSPCFHAALERISPDPDALLHALAKSIWCSASFSPGNTRARPRTSSRKVRRTLVLFANIAAPASPADTGSPQSASCLTPGFVREYFCPVADRGGAQGRGERAHRAVLLPRDLAGHPRHHNISYISRTIYIRLDGARAGEESPALNSAGAERSWATEASDVRSARRQQGRIPGKTYHATLQAQARFWQ